MRRPELEQKILDYIKSLYKADYIGLLEVEQIDEVNLVTQEVQPLYKFKIGVPSYMVPTVTSINVDNDDDFLTFIYEDLRVRNYMKIDKYKVVRTENIKEE